MANVVAQRSHQCQPKAYACCLSRPFSSPRGGPLHENIYGRAWHAVRAAALGPEAAAGRCPPIVRPAVAGLRRATWVYAAMGSSGGDGDLAACFSGVEIAHGLGYLVQRVAPVDARRQFAGVDELGEPFQVGGAFLAQDSGQPLAHGQ
jgi:hypothetical protein